MTAPRHPEPNARKSAWEEVAEYIWRDRSTAIAQVIVSIKAHMWGPAPVVFLAFDPQATPRYHLEKTNQAAIHLWKEWDGLSLDLKTQKVQTILLSKLLVFEGMRQKFFPWMSSYLLSNESWEFLLVTDLIRTATGLPQLNWVRSMLEIFCIRALAGKDPLSALLENTQNSVCTAEASLQQEAARWALDWEELLAQKWRSGFFVRRSYFPVRRGYARYGFAQEHVVPDLWRILAPYYGVDLPVKETRSFRTPIYRHIAALLREDMPDFSGNLSSKKVYEIVRKRLKDGLYGGGQAKRPGLYQCIHCGRYMSLNEGHIAPPCRCRGEKSHETFYWLRKRGFYFYPPVRREGRTQLRRREGNSQPVPSPGSALPTTRHSVR